MGLKTEKEKFRQNNPNPNFLKYIYQKITEPIRKFIYPPKNPTVFAQNSVNCWLKGRVHNYETYEMQRDYCQYCGRLKLSSGINYGTI